MNKSPGKCPKPQRKQTLNQSYKLTVGFGKVLGRDGKEGHLRCCLEAGNSLSPTSSLATLLSPAWCSASASQSGQCDWSLHRPSLQPSSSSPSHLRTGPAQGLQECRVLCGLWQRLGMCLRDFPNSSELARAGSGPLKPSELIHCRSEKSTFHCFPLETLHHQLPGLCWNQLRKREEPHYFFYWKS